MTGRVTLDGDAPARERWPLDDAMLAASGESEYVDETLPVGVPPGDYRVRVWHESLGYADLPRPGTPVEGGGTVELDVRYQDDSTRTR